MRPPTPPPNFIFMSDQNSPLIFACLSSQIFWSKRVRGNAGYLNLPRPTVRDDFYDLISHKVGSMKRWCDIVPGGLTALHNGNNLTPIQPIQQSAIHSVYSSLCWADITIVVQYPGYHPGIPSRMVEISHKITFISLTQQLAKAGIQS